MDWMTLSGYRLPTGNHQQPVGQQPQQHIKPELNRSNSAMSDHVGGLHPPETPSPVSVAGNVGGMGGGGGSTLLELWNSNSSAAAAAAGVKMESSPPSTSVSGQNRPSGASSSAGSEPRPLRPPTTHISSQGSIKGQLKSIQIREFIEGST